MELQGKIQETFEHFTPASSPEEIDKIVEGIIARRYKAAYTIETLRFLFSTIDLTTLAGADTKESVQKLVETVNHTASHPEEGLPNVAAVCVYPLQVPVVKEFMKADGVRIAAVSGGFPASQTFLEIKLAETALTVAAGADEIDIVLNLNHFLPGNYSAVVEEIEEQKAACRSAHLKVILETGLLKDPELVRKASILSLYSGADFIKTSTGFYTGEPQHAAPGASDEMVALMMEAAAGRCLVKGSAAIRDRDHFLRLIDAGIDRIGIGYRSTPVVLGLSGGAGIDGTGY